MTEPTPPKYPRATPRRSIVMADDVWEPLSELALRRQTNASTLLRQLAADELARARAAGEIPKRHRRKSA